MELCSKKCIETNIKITKINENPKLIGNEYLNLLKINISRTKRINRLTKNSKEGKKKYIYQNNKNSIKAIQDSNNLKNELSCSINKSFPTIYSYLKFISNKKEHFLNSMIIILIIKLFFFSCKSNQEKLLLNFSEITLLIRGPGNIKILSDKFFRENNPYEIYINDSSIEIKNEYYFNNSENITVKVKWNSTITNTNNMFQNCDRIIKIDLSNLNTSQITNMSYMFYGCSSLSLLNLDNIDTSNVYNMSYMFYNCS